MIIISIIIFLSVFFLLKDLHIEVYNNRHRCVKIDEYKFKYRIWHIIVILLFSFMPVINIIAFIGFLIYYFYYIKLTYDFLRHYFKRNTSMLLNTVAICFLCFFAMHIAVVSYSGILQNILILFITKALVIQKSSVQLEE